MNLQILSRLSVVAGIIIVAFAGSAISRHAGIGDRGWLMLAFGFGILLMSQGPVLKLQQQVRDLQRQLAARGGA
jgi:hypothetical protein